MYPICQEKLYIDKDFPIINGFKSEPTLDKSPKDLGISRADFWAFAGLVALDEFQQKTKVYCEFDRVGSTCNQTDCYSSFDLEQFQKTFQTGRTDCKPKNSNPKCSACLRQAGPFSWILSSSRGVSSQELSRICRMLN